MFIDQLLCRNFCTRAIDYLPQSAIFKWVQKMLTSLSASRGLNGVWLSNILNYFVNKNKI